MLCQVMRQTNFWNGMRSKKTIFHNKRELLPYCLDDVNVLRQACYDFRKLFLKFVKKDPFRQAITISSIYIKVFQTIFLKLDSVGLMPKGGYLMGHRQSVEALQFWRTLVERGTMLLMPVMEGWYINLDYHM